MEKLAFPIIDASERDFPEICADPLPLVVKALNWNMTVEQVFENPPDIEAIQAHSTELHLLTVRPLTLSLRITHGQRLCRNTLLTTG